MARRLRAVAGESGRGSSEEVVGKWRGSGWREWARQWKGGRGQLWESRERMGGAVVESGGAVAESGGQLWKVGGEVVDSGGENGGTIRVPT